MGNTGLFQVLIAAILTFFILGVLLEMCLLFLPKSWAKTIRSGLKNALIAIWRGAWSLVWWILTAPIVGLYRAIFQRRTPPPPRRHPHRRPPP